MLCSVVLCGTVLYSVVQCCTELFCAAHGLYPSLYGWKLPTPPPLHTQVSLQPLCSVQSALCSVLCGPCKMQGGICSVQCGHVVCSVIFVVCSGNVQCVMYNVQCVVCYVQCSVFNLFLDLLTFVSIMKETVESCIWCVLNIYIMYRVQCSVPSF